MHLFNLVNAESHRGGGTIKIVPPWVVVVLTNAMSLISRRRLPMPCPHLCSPAGGGGHQIQSTGLAPVHLVVQRPPRRHVLVEPVVAVLPISERWLNWWYCKLGGSFHPKDFVAQIFKVI